MRFVCNEWILKINPPYLQKGLGIPSCNDGVVVVGVSSKDQVSCCFLRGGSCSWHFWWKSHQLELFTTRKEICWIFVRYKARVAERQDTMQLQVVASQLRSFVLMNAAKDVWEALMKGIKPFLTVWVTLMVEKYPPFQCLNLRSDIFWCLYCLGVINRTFLITVHCRSEKYGVFILDFLRVPYDSSSDTTVSGGYTESVPWIYGQVPDVGRISLDHFSNTVQVQGRGVVIEVYVPLEEDRI